MSIFRIGALSISILCLSPLTYGANAPSLPQVAAQLQQYQSQGAGPFSAAAGQQFWLQDTDGRSCASCHGANVTLPGQHQNTHKPIEPMAPSINPQRLTDAANIEKWFSRNCQWTLKRDCTAQEKGDVLLWLSAQ
ncbi:MAG: DUF1924 domain-containing protein [Shewanella sp.]